MKRDNCLHEWMSKDRRLENKELTSNWTYEYPLRTDFERRKALVEIDVLAAMALGMDLEQLINIYRIQFSVLRSYEADTWYDTNGRIIFTNNRSLSNVGLSRSEWEEVKNMQDGVGTHVILDDTLPIGQVERTIEYVAPFDRCDREKDYEEVWANFEKRFSGGGKS